MKVIDRLEEQRIELGMTKREMAAKIGVAAGTYSLYLNGRIQPRPSTVESFAEKLGVTFEFLTCYDSNFKQIEGVHTYATLIPALLGLLASDSIGSFTMDEVGSMDGRAGIRITSYDPNLYNFFQCYETFKGLRDAGNITDSAFETMIGSLVSALDGKAESE